MKRWQDVYFACSHSGPMDAPEWWGLKHGPETGKRSLVASANEITVDPGTTTATSQHQQLLTGQRSLAVSRAEVTTTNRKQLSPASSDPV